MSQALPPGAKRGVRRAPGTAPPRSGSSVRGRAPEPYALDRRDAFVVAVTRGGERNGPRAPPAAATPPDTQVHPDQPPPPAPAGSPAPRRTPIMVGRHALQRQIAARRPLRCQARVLSDVTHSGFGSGCQCCRLRDGRRAASPRSWRADECPTSITYVPVVDESRRLSGRTALGPTSRCFCASQRPV